METISGIGMGGREMGDGGGGGRGRRVLKKQEVGGRLEVECSFLATYVGVMREGFWNLEIICLLLGH